MVTRHLELSTNLALKKQRSMPKPPLHAVQASKFVISGSAGYLLDLWLVWTLVEVGKASVMVSYIASSTVVLVFLFVTNKYWTFKNRDGNYRMQISLFLAVYLTAILLNFLIAYGLFISGIWYLLSRAIATIVTAIWNYWWSHLAIFRPIYVSSNDDGH